MKMEPHPTTTTTTSTRASGMAARTSIILAAPLKGLMSRIYMGGGMPSPFTPLLSSRRDVGGGGQGAHSIVGTKGQGASGA